MAQVRLNRFGMSALGDEQRCAGVPQVMDPEIAGEPGLEHSPVPHLAPEVAVAEGPTQRRGEHERSRVVVDLDGKVCGEELRLPDDAEAVARVKGTSVNCLIIDALKAEIERVRQDEDFTSRAKRLLERKPRSWPSRSTSAGPVSEPSCCWSSAEPTSSVLFQSAKRRPDGLRCQ